MPKATANSITYPVLFPESGGHSGPLVDSMAIPILIPRVFAARTECQWIDLFQASPGAAETLFKDTPFDVLRNPWEMEGLIYQGRLERSHYNAAQAVATTSVG